MRSCSDGVGSKDIVIVDAEDGRGDLHTLGGNDHVLCASSTTNGKSDRRVSNDSASVLDRRAL